MEIIKEYREGLEGVCKGGKEGGIVWESVEILGDCGGREGKE